ncbi:MAG: hypothetical protein KKB25_00150 [Nanoarchaeota archaeon]|nr:hypothetical protein [Nanoarchaeota archaeon]
MFCRYCKGMLFPKSVDGKNVLYCRKCDQPYEMKNRKDFVFKTDIKPSAD